MIDAAAQINAHLERNEVLKRDLIAKGVPLDECRSVELHFWAFTNQEAVLLAKALYDEGLLILALAPLAGESGQMWNVEAGAKETVDNLTGLSKVRQFVELAARFNAVYDGWGTTV